jgi:hypothetical protein
VSFVSLAFDPANTSTVYAVGGGIRKSIDGGDTWAPIDSSILTGGAVSALLIDPLIPSTMVAVGNNTASGFVRTVDGGSTWDLTAIEVPGKDPFLYHGVLDPLSANRLIMGASGAGIAEYEIAPDLEITLAGPAQAVPLGLPTAVTINVRNLGPHASSASKVRMPLPQWLLPSTPSGCAIVGQAMECGLGVLRVNATRAINVPLTASAAPSTAQIDVTIEGHESDPVSNNSAARFNLQATEQADLAVAFTGANPALDDHAAVILPIDITNHGPNASTNTVLTIELVPPAQAAALITPTAAASQGTCTLAGTTLTCTLGTINNGAVAHVDVSATTAVVGTTQVTATADGNGTDTGTDQGATRTLTIRAVGDAAVEITDSADPISTNVPWQYTATVRNNGPDESTVGFTMTLTGATPTAVNSPGGACTISGADVTCALTSIANGASSTVTVTANSSAAGSASATAQVQYAGTDTTAANNSATATTTKVAPPPPPKPKGGGGSFDWLALLLLGGVLLRRRAA